MRGLNLTEPERQLWDAFAVAESVILRNGEDRVIRAEVIRRLLLGGNPANPGEVAHLRLRNACIAGELDLSHVQVGCLVRLEMCDFDVRPQLYGAHLKQLNLRGSALPGLFAANTVFEADLRLRNVRCAGTVDLSDARIGGTLMLDGARIDGGERPGVAATRLSVGRDILAANGFDCVGEILLNDADVGGSIRCEGASLANTGGRALFAPDLTVGAICTLCDGCRIDGSVHLQYATIGSRLCFDRAVLVAANGLAINAHHLQTKDLVLTTAVTIDGDVDLRHAQIGLLRDDPDRWPRQLRLDGMQYHSLSVADTGVQRAGWLRLDPDGYRPQAYEHLAAVYRRLGRDQDARDVLLAGQRHRRETLSAGARFWGHLQDLTVGYGYRPTRAAAWFIALLLVGTAFFATRHPTPAQAGQNVEFNPLVYTLDLLLPLVDFGQERVFASQGAQAWLAHVLIAAGWLLVTTIAAGATRTLRRT